MSAFDHNLADLPVDEDIEVEPGLIVRRRALVSIAPAMLFGAAAFLAGGRAGAAEPRKTITFEHFLEEANRVAGELVGDTSREGQARYLHAIAAVASRLESAPGPVSWNDSGQSLTPGTLIGFTPGGDPFTVLQWRMEPGTRIRYHAHTYGNVVTVGLAGAARVRNFEVVGGPDYTASGAFQVRRTVDQILEPGMTNLVNLDRNYIHGFEAGPDGAHGIDITTRIKPRPGGGTPFLEIREERALDEFQQIFEARWAYDEDVM